MRQVSQLDYGAGCAVDDPYNLTKLRKLGLTNVRLRT
jgi:hypothetical protein